VAWGRVFGPVFIRYSSSLTLPLFFSSSPCSRPFTTSLRGVSQVQAMSASPAPPDISALSLAPHSALQQPQRLHDTHEFDGPATSPGRAPYYFSSSPQIPLQSQYNPPGMSASPFKIKPAVRGGLPTVCYSCPFHSCPAHQPTAMVGKFHPCPRKSLALPKQQLRFFLVRWFAPYGSPRRSSVCDRTHDPHPKQ